MDQNQNLLKLIKQAFFKFLTQYDPERDPLSRGSPCVWVNAQTKFGIDPKRNLREKLHKLWNELTNGKKPVVELPIQWLKRLCLAEYSFGISHNIGQSTNFPLNPIEAIV